MSGAGLVLASPIGRIEVNFWQNSHQTGNGSKETMRFLRQLRLLLMDQNCNLDKQRRESAFTTKAPFAWAERTAYVG